MIFYIRDKKNILRLKYELKIKIVPKKVKWVKFYVRSKATHNFWI